MRIFNRIRSNLLHEGKFGRYLRYAIGEIILVVIGILLALSINSWNTRRLEKKQEVKILRQIKEEYKDNRAQLVSKIQGRFEIMNAAKRIIAYRDTAKTVPPDSLEKYVPLTLFRPTFDPATGVMDELVNSGKLYLIANDSLRILLTNWYGKYFTEVREEEQVAMDFVQREYLPFLMHNYQLRNAFHSIYESSELEYLWFTFDKEQFQTLLKPSEINDTGKKLLSNEYLENYMTTLILYHSVANNQSVGVLEKMDEALDLIDRELEK